MSSPPDPIGGMGRQPVPGLRNVKLGTENMAQGLPTTVPRLFCPFSKKRTPTKMRLVTGGRIAGHGPP